MPGADFRGTAGEQGRGIVVADGFQVGDVPLVKKLLTATATIDPASINDGDSATATMTVTGAALGDIAIVAPPYSLQGLQMTAYVSAANTVTIVLFNNTGGAVDLPSGTWKAMVFSNA